MKIDVGYPQPDVRDNRDVLIQEIQAAVRKNIGVGSLQNSDWRKLISWNERIVLRDKSEDSLLSRSHGFRCEDPHLMRARSKRDGRRRRCMPPGDTPAKHL